MALPLLIGGATTSPQHTAVKIAPEYSQSTVHVLDASRVVDVVSKLLHPTQRPELERANRARQAEIRRQFSARQDQPLLGYREAVKNRLTLDWTEPLPAPPFLGARVLDDVALDELVPFIDWTFFFAAWELKGRYPAILEHPHYGAAARELFGHAQTLLTEIVSQRLLTARGVYGFWPAASDGDDVVVFADETRTSERIRFTMLRQQERMADGRPNLSLADFVAPQSVPVHDYVGAFAVTAGLGTDDLVRQFEDRHDDYHAIMVKALADRLVEAFATWLHVRARREWGGEAVSVEDAVAERHHGIRPGFGYPACPDHSEKFKLFDLLAARRIGIDLTEHAAMTPASSVSGLYFAHPAARYFSVGRVGLDQVEEYARRKGLSVDAVERWLTPNLSYEPVRA